MSTLAVQPDSRIAAAQAAMESCEQAECPVIHRFTEGMYIREIFMPAGVLVASKLHKTQHPFVIRKGRVSVRMGDTVEELSTGHMGITQPGTHRLLYVHEDTVWVTFHPNPDNLTNLLELEERIIQPFTPCLG